MLTGCFLSASFPRETEASLESVVPMALLDLWELVVPLVPLVTMVLRYANRKNATEIMLGYGLNI